MKNLKIILCLLILIPLMFFSVNSSENNSDSDNINFEIKSKKFKENIIKIKIDTATVYNPTHEQCDGSPNSTADGSIIDISNPNKHRWVALSRDLINCPKRAKLFEDTTHWRGKFSFGDTIKVVSKDSLLNGFWVVHDCMNKRYSKRIDFLQGEDGFYGRWTDLILIKENS